MPRLTQQEFIGERRGEERRGVGGGREGCDGVGEEQGERGGRLAGGRKKERGEWEGLSKLGTGSKLHWKLKVNK